MPRDPAKAKARRQRYLEKLKVEKYGPEASGVDMRGRHGNHARGERNGRFNMDERRVTSQGYIAVRVAVDHPHGWGPKRLRGYRYAYEHVVVAMARLSRPLRPLEVVHHRDGDKTNNAPSNLVVTTRSDHAKTHDKERGRDWLGRFPVGHREWPEVTK